LVTKVTDTMQNNHRQYKKLAMKYLKIKPRLKSILKKWFDIKNLS